MEIWNDVKGYEGIYQVSSFGRIKSLGRIVLKKGKYPFLSKEKTLNPSVNNNGYYIVGLCKNGKSKTRTIHQLVAETFLNHVPCGLVLVVNHINFNKLDNRVENLEIVTTRENSNKIHLKSTSKYVGVCWRKDKKKWNAYISINGKRKHLGLFDCELEASNAYECFLSNFKADSIG